MRAIIPCCGFGTRMNMAFDQSKEMLIDPLTNQPIIQYSINLCNKYGIEPFVATRKEKKDLIAYIQLNNIKHAIIEPGFEWPHTVSKTEEYWDEQNVLILPDVKFEPDYVLEQIKASLEFGMEVIYAIHKVDNITKWGYVNKFTYSEKPNLQLPGTAWGILGFTKKAGSVIFNNMQNKSVYYSHDLSTNFVFLNSFKDITRTGKLE